MESQKAVNGVKIVKQAARAEAKPTNEEKYPSVSLAYEITLRSYDLAIKRSDFLDDSIDKLIVWATGINLGVITLVLTKFSAATLQNRYFYIAAALFASVVVMGYTAKLIAGLRVQNPKILYNSWLHKSVWNFQKDIIYLGADHFTKNMLYINRKAKFLGCATFTFLLEMSVLGYWVMVVSH
ncbi:MAG: hypothetical protein P8123_01810 [bacterium]